MKNFDHSLTFGSLQNEGQGGQQVRLAAAIPTQINRQRALNELRAKSDHEKVGNPNVIKLKSQKISSHANTLNSNKWLKSSTTVS